MAHTNRNKYLVLQFEFCAEAVLRRKIKVSAYFGGAIIIGIVAL